MGQSGNTGRWLLTAAALVAGLLGLVTVWVTLAVLSGRACGWVALVGAVDYALLLRLVRTPAGPIRTALAVLATALTAVASAWFIVAAQLGSVFGLDPVASAMRLGPVLAWEYTRLGFGPWDWGCVAFAPVLALALVARARGEAA
jgi:hypothetical protein